VTLYKKLRAFDFILKLIATACRLPSTLRAVIRLGAASTVQKSGLAKNVNRERRMDYRNHLPNSPAAAMGHDVNVPPAVAANEGSVTSTGSLIGVGRFPAEFEAGGVKAVQAVAAPLGVRLDADYQLSDVQIKAAALDRLARDESVPRDSVMVAVERGWATLTGQVDWQFQSEAIEQRLRRLPGVMGVSNHMSVKAGMSVASSEVMNGVHGRWMCEPKTASSRDQSAHARQN
jgi:osmotically-inducible protein OsmY